ncbi:unnamed protein product [Pieris macdunnoughi]|uniref:CCHC-type domain-containing protein n=1 Tax=Pieris macdunnoughi TaxID=345717 RepID=A0A821SPH1_9NEOP|nr:unnamed protein product [Pieris macdunnoughi]
MHGCNSKYNSGRRVYNWMEFGGGSSFKSAPVRCYKCLELGHTQASCSSTVDRGNVCYRDTNLSDVTKHHIALYKPPILPLHKAPGAETRKDRPSIAYEIVLSAVCRFTS